MENERKNFWKNKYFIIPTAVAVILALGFAIIYVDLSSLKRKIVALETQEEQASVKYDKLNGQYVTLNTDYTELETEYTEIKTKYENYKKKMKPFEEMEAAVAKQKKAEAEAALKAQTAQDEAMEAVKKIWDFDNGTLVEGATRELCTAAANKINAITDEAVKSSLNEALTAATEALAQAEQAAAEEEMKRKAEASATTEQKNALSKAKDYLSISAFSYDGLIKQLNFEGFSSDAATYAADHCGADWNEQAAKKAQDYLDLTSFSRSGLIDQLEFEGFTREQAEYGATAVGY